jgi:hypothetical protein
MRTFILFALAASLCTPCLVSTGDESSETVTPVPDGKKKSLSVLMAGLPELGAKPAGAASFFTNNLWEYIDGGAEAFHNYDFAVLIHRVFQAGEAEVTVDVYDMADPLNAFGIYSAERSPDYRFLPVGVQGYGDAFSFCFFHGPYYAKISLFQEGTPDSTLLRRVAENLSARMGAAGGFPDVFKRFPALDAVANSEKFVKKSPLGHAFLGPAFAMAYRAGAGTSDLLVLSADNAVRAAEWVQKLKTHFQETGKVVPLDGLGAGAFLGVNEYEGRMAFLCVGDRVLIQNSQEPADISPLKQLAENMGKPE